MPILIEKEYSQSPQNGTNVTLIGTFGTVEQAKAAGAKAAGISAPAWLPILVTPLGLTVVDGITENAAYFAARPKTVFGQSLPSHLVPSTYAGWVLIVSDRREFCVAEDVPVAKL